MTGKKPKSVEIVKDLEGAPTEDLEQARAELERLVNETTDWFLSSEKGSKPTMAKRSIYRRSTTSTRGRRMGDGC